MEERWFDPVEPLMDDEKVEARCYNCGDQDCKISIRGKEPVCDSCFREIRDAEEYREQSEE